MKTAYQYIRISDEDQSNFSISGQEKANEIYALKNNIIIAKTFTDDGVSAKDFNRPQWRELERELAKNKNKIDYLIIFKYDRLIRNAAEGLAFIEKLEQKWDIRLLSVSENFFIDPHSPYFFKARADLLVNAEYERRVISDRSKFGVWSAKSQGRFIGVAPFGYDNARDQENKPIITVNPIERPIVEHVFEDFLNNVPFPLIMDSLKKKGFPIKGHDALIRLISNPAYGGLVTVPKYKEEKSIITKGIHEAIIPEETYWMAYYKLQDKINPQGTKTIDDNLPLRGFLLCQSCGKLHTGAKSRGRSAYYYYYRCNTCRKENYKAETVHSQITQILNSLSLGDRFIKALHKTSEEMLDKQLEQRNFKLKILSKELQELEIKINGLEQKFISDKIDESTYQKWFPIYKRDYRIKEGEQEELQRDDRLIRRLYADNIHYLSDLNWIYQQGDVQGKQALLKGIFPGGLIKEREGYGTAFVFPAFSLQASKIKDLVRVKTYENSSIYSHFPISTRNGNEMEPFLRIIAQTLRRSAPI